MKKRVAKDWYDHLGDMIDDADYNTSYWNPVSVVILIMIIMVVAVLIIS